MAQDTPTRACATCGREFTPRARGGRPQVRCSERCRRKVANANYIRNHAPARPDVCAECGGKVEHGERGRPRRFCSETCKMRAGNRRTRRAQEPAPKADPRPCEHCGKTFQPKRRDRRYCYGGWCAQAAYQARKAAGATSRMGEREFTCHECWARFTAKHPAARWCSHSCQIRHRSREASRRRSGNQTNDGYTDREIFERDNWTCHLCGKQLDPATDRRRPDGPTIDHVIPLSRGGTDVRANVKTACNRCNRQKAARIEGDA